jgi:predicted ABC-type ATPase
LEKAPDPAQPQDAPRDIEPLTDAEYADHVQEVRQRIEEAQAKGQVTYKEYTLDRAGEIWLKERTAQHVAIIDSIYERAAGVPAEHQAIIAGGLPGAGKTTVLERYAGIDRSQFLTINPDDIKEEMARRGLTPHVEGLSPMETSDLIHEESSFIAKRLANVAQAEGKNIIWDITMLSRATTERRIDELQTNGYTHIEAVFVDIPLEVCKARAETRHRIGNEEYRAGKGEGGRLIPEDLIEHNSDPIWGNACRKTFEEVKDRFDRWSVYDNSADGLPAVLTHSSEIEKRRQ